MNKDNVLIIYDDDSDDIDSNAPISGLPQEGEGEGGRAPLEICLQNAPSGKEFWHR